MSNVSNDNTHQGLGQEFIIRLKILYIKDITSYSLYCMHFHKYLRIQFECNFSNMKTNWKIDISILSIQFLQVD